MRRSHRGNFTSDSYRRMALALGAVTASGSAAMGALVQISLSGNFIRADANRTNRGTINNHLNFDFGGDGLADAAFGINADARARGGTYPNSYRYPNVNVGVTIPVNRFDRITIFADADAAAGFGTFTTGYDVDARAGAWRSYSSRPYRFESDLGATGPYSHAGADVTDFVPISITDSFINGGDAVQAWLHYSAGSSANRSGAAAALRLLRVVFDDENFGVRPAEYDHGGERFGLGPDDGPFPEYGRDAQPGPVPEPSGLALLALGAGGLLARRGRTQPRNPPDADPSATEG